jgi:glycosyltransferase involved in cell wall biosynthesis
VKILVVTAYYPPHHIGGYELGCRDVVNQLRQRGHQVHVLTSDFQSQNQTQPDEPEVCRELARVSTARPLKKKVECGKLDRALQNFRPDLVYFWSQSELCHWLPLLARWRGYRMAFFLSDTSFVFWRVGAWLLRLAEKSATVRALFGNTFLVRGRPVIQNQTCHFASEFLRGVAAKNRIPIANQNSCVAHWGIELAQFSPVTRERWPVRRLLYVGQMIPQKGVHTAIAAFALLAKEPGFEDLTLSLAGGGMNPDYEQKLRSIPAQLGVAGRVRFLGQVPRAELPRIYAEHDALIFPSEWDEPFAITPLEAMASGLAVVGTTTGGSGELFRNRETAMTFCAGDAVDCARALRELCGDHDLFQTIFHNGRCAVREKHTLNAMIDKIEGSLKKLVAEN